MEKSCLSGGDSRGRTEDSAESKESSAGFLPRCCSRCRPNAQSRNSVGEPKERTEADSESALVRLPGPERTGRTTALQTRTESEEGKEEECRGRRTFSERASSPSGRDAALGDGNWQSCSELKNRSRCPFFYKVGLKSRPYIGTRDNFFGSGLLSPAIFSHRITTMAMPC